MPGNDAPARLRETKHHGTPLFPFNIYPCTIPVDFLSVPLHWQNSMELIFIKRGQGLAQVGLTTYPAAAGDIFVLAPGTLHGLRGLPGVRMEYENFIFTLELLGGGPDDSCTQQYLLPLQAGRLALPAKLGPNSPGYADYAGALREAETLCARRAPGYELGVKGAMLRFLSLLFAAEALAPAEPDSHSTRRLKAVLELVENRYATPLTVADAAACCGCSASHFMRWFKQSTGTGFAAFLNERRLAAAANALRTTDEKVLAVAEGAGFENLSNFNRQFKARYGVTPMAYRAAR